jgi:hypothetical protein
MGGRTERVKGGLRGCEAYEAKKKGQKYAVFYFPNNFFLYL